MRLPADRGINGTTRASWETVERQFERAEREVVAHPAIGLAVAAAFGVLIGIWLKRL